MIDPIELYLKAQALGLQLEVDGDSLLVWPQSKCPPDFRDSLLAHKPELLAWLTPRGTHWGEVPPPPGLPLNPVRPCSGARDACRVMEYIVRQIGRAPNQLCEWCLRRETAYWDTYGWPVDVCAYAAARDAACWQLDRAEPDVWELLQTTEGMVLTRDSGR